VELRDADSAEAALDNVFLFSPVCGWGGRGVRDPARGGEATRPTLCKFHSLPVDDTVPSRVALGEDRGLLVD